MNDSKDNIINVRSRLREIADGGDFAPWAEETLREADVLLLASIPVSQLRALSETWQREAYTNDRAGERYVARAYRDCIADLDRLLPSGDQEPRR